MKNVNVEFFVGKIKDVTNEDVDWTELKGMEVLICSVQFALLDDKIEHVECPIQKDEFNRFFEFIRKWEYEYGFAESETLESFKKEYIEEIIPGYGSPTLQESEYDFVRSLSDEEIKKIDEAYKEYFGIKEGE